MQKTNIDSIKNLNKAILGNIILRRRIFTNILVSFLGYPAIYIGWMREKDILNQLRDDGMIFDELTRVNQIKSTVRPREYVLADHLVRQKQAYKKKKQKRLTFQGVLSPAIPKIFL
ncbi:hypothetical protein PHYBLDRAFT_59468 [Phycomyces blakesleeanus NRRL 1555(-)]|uniref:Uncharacterized protein n=1 Tax=Phycomyces blakesleeanus (strain ATCC 8743b / DSM 1359 / FGSC 10004 / NBRC 33097 / NRRL 1555) TaxID=763407 RepID=A0A163AUQ2_PHYB8|nr:hypothetical protein PHYBLDRAFT_59468 [Phycomyces blakesleeanus NRRL 1555(-)]OAD75941.1 hypothetical protein PHYBLDRAFT_59468 [Phycomyces blakesleeanus NRRL 1555(-)]|eukprot:XP_018293981.1 hypothetical protein PHYBLDRAFT_59468 [Phycomyces blakesleeanus NRRL 1555(-)]